MPSRECFRDRIAPEGFAFGACKRCNNSAGQWEQAVALTLLLADHSDALPSGKQFEKLVTGVANNNPELMPKILKGPKAARHHFRAKGLWLSPGTTFAETTILELPAEMRAAFKLFARRLTCAIFYKEVGYPLPLDWIMAVAWSPWSEPATHKAADVSNNLFPEYVLTGRRNTNIGEQFRYRWGFHPEGNLFGFAAQFSKAYLIFGCAVAPSLHKGEDGWEPHSSDFPTGRNVSPLNN
ncbi:hypothetical protein GCM10009087_02420 [Sphingomonas oligophenolica]